MRGNERWLLELMAGTLFLLLLVRACLEDLRRREIPDRIGVLLVAAGLCCHIAGISPPGCGPGPLEFSERLAGFFCVSIPLGTAACLAPGSFGGGDIKLCAAGGFFLGWKAMLSAGAMAVLSAGAAVAVFLLTGRISRREGIPFGPFLCLGMTAGFFWGEELARWYVGK